MGDLADPPILILTELPPPLVNFLVITISESSTHLSTMRMTMMIMTRTKMMMTLKIMMMRQ